MVMMSSSSCSLVSMRGLAVGQSAQTACASTEVVLFGKAQAEGEEGKSIGR